MNSTLRTALALGVATLLSLHTATSRAQPVVINDLIEAKAIIESVDLQSRTVLLRGDHGELEPVAGGTGLITFSRPDGTKVEALTVVEADPPRRFAFRWVYDQGGPATAGNSLLVTFDLVPSGSGTLLRFSEEGFRERGWEAAVLEETYHDHVAGWDYFLPRLVAYAAGLAYAS